MSGTKSKIIQMKEEEENKGRSKKEKDDGVRRGNQKEEGRKRSRK